MSEVLSRGVGHAGVHDAQLFEPRKPTCRPQGLVIALLSLQEDIAHGIEEVWPESCGVPNQARGAWAWE